MSSSLQRRFFIFCVAPSLAVLAIITLLPALYLLVTSFTPLNLTRPETAWDFSDPLISYRQLLTDDRGQSADRDADRRAEAGGEHGEQHR